MWEGLKVWLYRQIMKCLGSQEAWCRGLRVASAGHIPAVSVICEAEIVGVILSVWVQIQDQTLVDWMDRGGTEESVSPATW